MKNIFIHLLSFVLLLSFSITAAAQNTDSLYKIKEQRDSIYWLTHTKNYVADSFYNDHKVKLAAGYKKKQQQDLFFKQRRSADTLRKKINTIVIENAKLYALKTDSTKKATTLYSRNTDSLQKRQKTLFVKSDSLRKMQALNIKLDTFKKPVAFRRTVSDSLRKKIYLQQIKTDSLRIKEYLQQKKIQSQNLSEDTLVIKQGYEKKRLSMEITCKPGDTIYINNNYKSVIINTRPSQKLKLSTTIFYKGILIEPDHKIFQKMGIELSGKNNSVTAIINGAKPVTDKNTNPACDETINMESSNKKPLNIELPGNVVIIINTKYTHTNIENFITSLKAEITNGRLKMENADYAVIKSNYSTIKVEDIKRAELNLSSTNFTGSNIVDMSVVSNSSIVKLDKCNSMNMASTRDDYYIEKAGSISGNKNFGKLQIEYLKDNLVLTGANTNVKIDNLSYEGPFIKIDSKYSDLKLPLYNQNNYTVNYEGSYNDLNKLSTATQKVNGLGNITARLSVVSDTLGSIENHFNANANINANVNANVKVNKTKFEAVAGNITGRHTKIDIVCPYCNVVFN